MADKQITRRLTIYVNGKEVDATITNLRKNLAKFRAQSNRAVEGSKEWKKYNAEVARTELELKQAYAAQKQFRQETKLTEQGIDKSAQSLATFSGSLSQMFNGLKRGDYIEVSEGFNGIKAGIKGATKAALSFIATPIGIMLTALAGIGVAAKQWLNYNTQVVEALRLTQQITGLTDQAADQARIRGEALVELFGVDFKETLETARNLSQQFGISFNQAFDVMEDQLVRGQKNNDEFFTSLKEYPTFFAQAGYSATEFGKIIATGYDLGIYNDKLPDALKEADISLREQTNSTREALLNAFGAPFTDSILQRVRSGKITTKQALEEIADQADKTGVNVQANAQLTADLFRGAGEDAGGALKVFEAVNIALNENQRELSESETITQQQIKATRELKQISSALFATGDKGFGLLIDKAKLFGTKLLVDILKTGVDVYNWFVDLNNESSVFSGFITGIGKIFTSSFSVIGEGLSLVWNQFKSLGTLVAGIFTFDIDKIKQGIVQGFSNIGDSFSKLKEKAIQDANDIYDAFSGKNKLERKTLGDFIGDEDPTSPASSPVGGGATDTGTPSGLTPEQEAELERIKAFEEKKRELKNQIELDQELTDQEKEELKAIQDYEKHLLELEDMQLKEDEKTQLLKLIEEARAAELAKIDKKYKALKEKSDKKAFQKELAARKKLQDDIINGAVNLAGQETRIGQALLAVKGVLAAKEMLIQLGLVKGKLAANVASSTGAIAEGTAQTAKVGFPQNIPLLIGFAAQVAGIIGAIKGATKATSEIKAYEDGGETFSGSYSGGVDGRGGRMSILHPNEYVIPEFVRKDPEVSPIIDYLENKRVDGLPGYENGGNTSAQATAIAPTNALTLEVLAKLSSQLDNGITAVLNFTLEDAIELKEFQNKLENTINASKN